MEPKVLVGCPTSDYHAYCLDEYEKAVKNLTYKNYKICLVDNSKDNNYYKELKKRGIDVVKAEYKEKARDRIVESRNILREKAIKEGYDYLLSLEQDVIPPLDIIERFLKHNKKVICGVYFNHVILKDKRVLLPLVYKVIEDSKQIEELPSMRTLNGAELGSNQLLEVVSCGLGCVMIHRDVLNKIKFRYDLNSHDDRWFCIDLFKLKIPIYCDTSIKCKHLVNNRPWDWSQLVK